MIETSNIEATQGIYEAFGRGDVSAVLNRCAENVRWEHHRAENAAQKRDVPYMRRRTGRDAAAQFFVDIAEDFELDRFEAHAFLDGGGFVAALIEFELTVKATGKRIHDEEIHLWHFDSDGKITAFRHFLDTAKAIEAHS